MAQKQQYSPMMQNYLQTKEQYKDCILLYRLGDFYEMFFEDAEEASRILDLTLTGKNCGMDERAPMCGVPFHAVDTYVAKLIAAGKKVAVCEQLSEPGGRELVRRDVVRVITPGTVMDSEILEDGKSNYLCALYFDDKMGVAFCDISTGEFVATELLPTAVTKDLQELLVAYKPSEILANRDAMVFADKLDCVKAGYTPNFSAYDEENFAPKRATEKLCRQYHVATLDGFGLAGKSRAITACAALLDYMLDTQKRELPHLKKIA